MDFQAQTKHGFAYRALGRYFTLNRVVCGAVRGEMEGNQWFPGGKIKCKCRGVDSALFREGSERAGVRQEMGITSLSVIAKKK